jgi:hypothetical protein
MEFTPTQLEILTNAWALGREGRGQVVQPWALPDAHELAEAGWLERKMVAGRATWWWSRQAEMALDLNALAESVEGREN